MSPLSTDVCPCLQRRNHSKPLVQFLASSQEAVLTNSRVSSRLIEFCAKFDVHALFRTLEYHECDERHTFFRLMHQIFMIERMLEQVERHAQ